ncbi:hypothetical protein BD311DRAFT_727550 [Dichomitus squalens]|uniref:F-box domain-containing protein n=2 Tax=Dichomitus squalens TaxID=114155 RepID=A0A4Q9MGB6_9APHY|nr:hypothetical protein BD311DRAFT_727550 [Dichomitus squalens]
MEMPSSRDAPRLDPSSSWTELAVEDQQILRVLDPSESQPWLLAKIQHYERYTRALCAAYNNASLIHRRLPPELLMEIFGHVRPKTCQGIHLLHVCRRWRDLALRTPQFWANMLRVSAVVRRAQAGEPLGLERFQTYLARSAPCLIPLTFRSLSMRIADILALNGQRISSLTVTVGPKQITDIYLLLSHGMPNLREVAIQHEQNSGIMQEEDRAMMLSVQCTEDKLPRLRSLRISNVFLSAAMVVPTLQSLFIGGCVCMDCTATSLDTILSVLRRCPSLLSLQFLEESEPRLPVDTPAISQVPVPLPLLDKLMFGKYPVEPLSAIISHLVLPPTVLLKFECDPRSGSLLPDALGSLPLISTLESLEVNTNESKCTARAHAGGAERLSFVTGIPARVSVVPELLSVFAPTGTAPSVTRLYLGFKSAAYSAHVDGPRMDALLAAFPRVRYVKMTRKCHHFFHSLTAASAQDVNAELPCPALEHLVLKWTVGWADGEFGLACEIAEKALARRAQKGLRLKRLEATFQRLHGLVGEEVDLEEVKRNVTARLAPYADEVVVELQPSPQRSRRASTGSGLGS